MRAVTLLLCTLLGACQGTNQGRVAPGQAGHGGVPEQAPPAVESAPRQPHAPPADTTPPIRTDRTLYVLRRDSASSMLFRAQARITYTNRHSSPVYLSGCPDGRPNIEVATVGPPMRHADLHSFCAQTARTRRIPVGSGETRTWPIDLQTIDRGLPERGPFRVLVAVYTLPEEGAGTLLRDEGRSNPFWVRLED